jgi:2-amino-4-hydroxy-6-hydroxymethyldihydropteridine diphosphokinase
MSRNFPQIFDDRSKFTRRKVKAGRGSHPVISYIGFGSNVGHRRKTIERALSDLAKTPGVAVQKVSSLYETEPVGGPPQADHLNGVVRIETTLPLVQLWRHLKLLERRAGRRKSIKWGPRPLDLDILTYGAVVGRRGRIVLPHPRYAERRFVMVPFSEIAPYFKHPQLHLKNRSLLRRLTPYGQRVTMLARWKNKRFYPFKKRKS